MDYGLFGVRFLFLDMKKERCSIDDYSSILQRPLLKYGAYGIRTRGLNNANVARSQLR